MKPDDVGKTLVTASEIFPIGRAGGGAVVPQGRKPVDRFHGIEEDRDAVLRGELDHVIEAAKEASLGSVRS